MTEIKKITVTSIFDGSVNMNMKIDKDLHQKCMKHNNSYNEIILLQLIRDYYE
jgi:hypothetical protein